MSYLALPYLAQWINNRQRRQELNNAQRIDPATAVDAATLWQKGSDSNEGSVTKGSGTTSGPVITEVPGTNNDTSQTNNGTTVTEGPGTTLIQQEDGTVIRVPTGDEPPGSTIIQTDLNEKENDINYDIIPKDDKSISEKVDELLSMEDAKAQWLHKTRNSPAQRSGAWDSDEGREELWQTHLRNQQWRKDKGRSYTHGHLLPSANEKTTTEKVDDFIQNGTTEEIPVEEQLPTTDQVPTEEQTTSGKVDDLLEKEANKRKDPQNPIELQLNAF